MSGNIDCFRLVSHRPLATATVILTQPPPLLETLECFVWEREFEGSRKRRAVTNRLRHFFYIYNYHRCWISLLSSSPRPCRDLKGTLKSLPSVTLYKGRTVSKGQHSFSSRQPDSHRVKQSLAPAEKPIAWETGNMSEEQRTPLN